MTQTQSLDVVVPYYRDTSGRETLLKYTSARWEEAYGESYGARVLVSGDGGPGKPFNRGRARNRAAALGDGEWLALWDTDVPPPGEQMLADAVRAAGRYGWSPVFSRTVLFTPEGTQRVLDGAPELELRDGDFYSVLPVCRGPMVVKRRVFEAVGGYDERYVGWGYEDTALRSLLGALYGQPPPPSGAEACWSLTLDPQTDKTEEGAANRELYLREYKWINRDQALKLVQRLHTQAP